MPTKYATHNELEGFKETVAKVERIESNPSLISQIQDKSELMKQKKAAQSQLDNRQAPAPKDDVERQALRARQNDLEAFLKLDCSEIGKPAMPSKHEMWETPAGSVGKELMWQNKVKNFTLDRNGNPVQAKDGYGAVFEWKDNQRKLRGEEEEYDKDIANVETLRPQNSDKSSFADYRKITFGTDPAYRQAYAQTLDSEHDMTRTEAMIEQKTDAPAKCAGKKSNGDPCGSYPIKGTKFCRKHQEKEQEQPAA